MTLVEGCAGSAALSLHLLGGKPPVHYQGGKRGYVEAITDELGLAPGLVDRFVLIEPGPWGVAWALWRDRSALRETIARVRGWERVDPARLWRDLARLPVPADLVERVARWAVLQLWSWGAKPIVERGGRWGTHGFNRSNAYRAEFNARAAARGHDTTRWAKRSRRLDWLADGLAALPDLSRVEVVQTWIQDYAPIPGALLYLDPPYHRTTIDYAHDLPRPKVAAVARAWHRAGCAVAVSEQSAIDELDGWGAVKLPRERGFGRQNFTAQRDEWLTVSP